MKKKRSYAGENYWPGYVDALVNVVLNLVFMVAVFGIALVVFNSVPKSNRLATPEDHHRAAERAAQRAAGVEFPTEGRLVDPMVNKAAEEAAAAAAVASLASDAAASVIPKNVRPPLDPSAVLMDPSSLAGDWDMGEIDVAARNAEPTLDNSTFTEVIKADVTNPDNQVTAQQGGQAQAAASQVASTSDRIPSASGISSVDATESQLAASDAGSTETSIASNAAEQSASETPSASPASGASSGASGSADGEREQADARVATSSNPADAVGDDGLGAKTQDLVTDQISIIVADTYERKGGPNAQLSQRTDNSGRTIMTLDVPVESDPIMTFARPYLSAAFEATLPLQSERFTVFTTTETKEPLRRRSAYLALSVIRNQLISTGVDPARIEMRMLDGALPSDVSIKFFVVASNDAPVARADQAAQQLEN